MKLDVFNHWCFKYFAVHTSSHRIRRFFFWNLFYFIFVWFIIYFLWCAFVLHLWFKKMFINMCRPFCSMISIMHSMYINLLVEILSFSFIIVTWHLFLYSILKRSLQSLLCFWIVFDFDLQIFNNYSQWLYVCRFSINITTGTYI